MPLKCTMFHPQQNREMSSLKQYAHLVSICLATEQMFGRFALVLTTRHWLLLQMALSKYGIRKPLRVSGPWTVGMQSAVHSFRVTSMYVDLGVLLPLFWFWLLWPQVAVGTKSGEILIYDIASSTLVDTIHAHAATVWSIQVHPDQRGLVSGSADKDVKFWDFEQKVATSDSVSTLTDILSLHSDWWCTGSKREDHLSCSCTNAQSNGWSTVCPIQSRWKASWRSVVGLYCQSVLSRYAQILFVTLWSQGTSHANNDNKELTLCWYWYSLASCASYGHITWLQTHCHLFGRQKC